MTDTFGTKIVNETFRVKLQDSGPAPTPNTDAPWDPNWLKITPGDVATISSGVVVDGKTSFVEIAGHRTAAAKLNLSANVAIGSIDVINAARNGTASDIAIQTAGLATSVWIGVEVGGATTTSLAWAGPWVAIPAGIVVGGATSYFGEKTVEEFLLQLREEISRPSPSNDAINGSIQINNDGSETHTYPDPSTGWQVQTKVIVDPHTGAKSAVHTTVIDPNSPMRGQTYPVNAVKNGYELNALDRISEESYIRTQQAVAAAQTKREQEIAAAAAAAAEAQAAALRAQYEIYGQGSSSSGGVAFWRKQNRTGTILPARASAPIWGARGWRGQAPRQPGQVRKEAAVTSPAWVVVSLSPYSKRTPAARIAADMSASDPFRSIARQRSV